MASQAVLKAVQTARLTQTRLLLQMGGDVYGRDENGKTTLIHALLLEDSKVRTRFLRLLLKAGAAVSVADRQKMNALMWACRVSSSPEVRLLLRHADEDLNLNAQNLKGETALWIAVDGGKVETVRELLQALSKHELSSEVPDYRGITPAMRAASLGHLHCLQALIAHLDTTGKSNNTLINIAKINQILKSMSIENEPKKTSVSHRSEDAGTQATTAPKLPSIQIISTGSYQSPTTVDPKVPQLELNSDYALFSLEFRRDPTRSSTPISFTGTAPSISHRPQRSDRVSPIPFNPEDPTTDHSLLGTERADTPASVRKRSTEVKFEDQGLAPNDDKWCVPKPLDPVKKTSGSFEDLRSMMTNHKRSVSTSPGPIRKVSHTVKFEDQNHVLTHPRRCVSTPPVNGSLSAPLFQAGAGRPDRVLLKPLVSVTMVRGSVRENLPELFDIIAQQTSDSFRKTAVKPAPKKVKRKISQGPVRSSWSKIRGVALLGGLTTAKGRKNSRVRNKSGRPSAVKPRNG